MNANDALIMETQKALFLPWQIEYLKDTSRRKILEKSRRVGGTWIQAFEDVCDCLEKKGHNGSVFKVWFSSADESAAKEYIDYVEEWVSVFQIGFDIIDEDIIDHKKGITAKSCKFANGNKIYALSSNPKSLRSKGGKLILDEFAHHDNDNEMWKAAKPITQWNYDSRILSTHNGQDCLFYQFIGEVEKGIKNWGHHKVDVYRAVNDGLVDCILGRKATEKEITKWLEEEKADCGSEIDWLQEYCCEATDESITHLNYELLNKCKKHNLNMKFIEMNAKKYEGFTKAERLDFLQELEITNVSDLYLGMDIGRKRNVSTIHLLEKNGTKRQLKIVIELEKMKYRHQKEILYKLLSHPMMIRSAIDSTGIGDNLAEDARLDFGNVEQVTFTPGNKERMATRFKTVVEDGNFEYEHYTEITEDFHSVQEKSGRTHKVYEAPQRKGQKYHGDHYWGAALAVDASYPTGSETTPKATTKKNRTIKERFNGFVNGKISAKLSRY